MNRTPSAKPGPSRPAASTASSLPRTTRAGQGDQPHAPAAHQGLHRSDLLLAAHQRGQRHRQRPGQRHLISGRRAALRLGQGEPLAQQHSQVVLDQSLQFGGVGEALVGNAALVRDPGEQLRQPGLAAGCRCLDVQQPGQSRRQQVLIFQPGDLLPGRHPAVALPVDPDEDLALCQISAVDLAWRVWPGAELEHHRHQPQPGHRGPHRPPLGGQLFQRRAHEHPKPLIRRVDDARLAHKIHPPPQGCQPAAAQENGHIRSATPDMSSDYWSSSSPWQLDRARG
jgi:hypothetical protein